MRVLLVLFLVLGTAQACGVKGDPLPLAAGN